MDQVTDKVGPFPNPPGNPPGGGSWTWDTFSGIWVRKQEEAQAQVQEVDSGAEQTTEETQQDHE